MERPVALNELLEEALDMIVVTMERHRIHLVKRVEEVPSVMGNRSKLIHVLVNLFKHAKEAMEDAPGDEEKTLTIEVGLTGDWSFIRVSDTGSGIHQDAMDRIFTHGFTTKKDGHGFGLHTCANYLTEMGGHIAAESLGPGEGATFMLTLPVGESSRPSKVMLDLQPSAVPGP